MAQALAGKAGIGKAGIGKNGPGKEGFFGVEEQETPPLFLGRTGETLHGDKIKPLQEMSPGLTEILGKIKAAITADQSFKQAVESGMKTIGIFVPVRKFDETCFDKQSHSRGQTVIDGLLGKPAFDLIPCDSKKGGWEHGDFVFAFSFLGKSEDDTDGPYQRLWAAVVISKKDTNKITNEVNNKPEEIFDSILQGLVAKGLLRTADGKLIVIDPGERAILLANKKYGGGWTQNYPSAHPFPKDFKPNS